MSAADKNHQFNSSVVCQHGASKQNKYTTKHTKNKLQKQPNIKHLSITTGEKCKFAAHIMHRANK